MDETTCTCGHRADQHQTGEGPWAGFCYGTLGQLGGEYMRPGDDPNEPCQCERFDDGWEKQPGSTLDGKDIWLDPDGAMVLTLPGVDPR